MLNEIKCDACGTLSDDERFLHENKWDHWYAAGKGWWVREDTVSDPTRQDYTGYLYPTADAVEFTKNPKPVPYYGDIGGALKTYVEMQRRRAAD